jgi:hypothetical protein
MVEQQITRLGIEELPACDVHLLKEDTAGVRARYFISVSSLNDAWMYACEQCYIRYGRGLGTKRGQYLVLKQPWTKWKFIDDSLRAGLDATRCGLTCTGCGEALVTEGDFARHFVIKDPTYLNLGNCPIADRQNEY